MGRFWHNAGLRSSTGRSCAGCCCRGRDRSGDGFEGRPSQPRRALEQECRGCDVPVPRCLVDGDQEERDGRLLPTGGSSVDFTTTFDVTANGRLNVGTVPICPTKAVYRAKTSGKLLTITKVSDKQCPTRAKLYSGVWKRK